MPEYDRFERERAQQLVGLVRSGALTRRDLVRRASVIGIGAMVPSLLAACGGGTTGGGNIDTREAKPRRGGTLRISTYPPVGAMQPFTNQDTASQIVWQQVVEYLVYLRPSDLTLHPNLATKWSSDDARTWTFALREGVRFNDGRPFGADDVVWSIGRLLGKSDSPSAANYTGILSAGNVEAIDDHTVRFHLDSAFADFPYLLTAASYNSAILPKGHDGSDFADKPIGTGPFLLEDINLRQRATLARNPKYRDGDRPYLDGIEVHFFDDAQPQFLAIQAAEIDVMADTPFQGSQALLKDPNIEVIQTKSPGFRGMHMKVGREPWNDVRVRQALALSIDRQAIVKTLLDGRGTLGNDNNFAPVYDIDVGVPQRERDVEQAKQLLADAGHPNGVDVKLSTENYLELPQYVTLVKEMAAEAGFRITLDVQTQAAYYGSGETEPWLEVDFGAVDWAVRPVPQMMTALIASCEGVWNAAGWCNRDFDKAMDGYSSTIDEAKRLAFARKAAAIQTDEVPQVIGYFLNLQRAIRTNVHGIEGTIEQGIEPLAAAYIA